MHKWKTLNLWTMKNLKNAEMSESCAWNTGNECHGVRWMVKNHEEGGWMQMQSSLKWNLKLKSVSNTYSNFDMIFKVPPMIFLRQATYGFEAKKLWSFEDDCSELKDHFKIILKFNLNQFQNNPNFKITLWTPHFGSCVSHSMASSIFFFFLKNWFLFH